MTESNQSIEKGTTYFVVGTEGHCFLCLGEIEISSESESEPEPGTVTPTTHSLQNLARYLKLNLGEALVKEGDRPSGVVSELERSQLKARLCEGCASLNVQFSELCGQLERIRMEVERCLGGIHGRLIQAEGKELELVEISTDQMLKSKIAGALRKHAIEKCSLKLRRSRPRVVLETSKVSDGRIDIDEDPLAATGMEPASGSNPVVKVEVEVEIENFQNPDDDDFFSDPDGGSKTSHDDHSDMEMTDFQVKQEVMASDPEPIGLLKSPPVTVIPDLPSSNLTSHSYSFPVTTETGTESHQCKTCGKKLPSRTDWSIHCELAHPTKPMKYRCRTCKLVLNTRTSVHQHQRRSRGACPWGQREVEVIRPPVNAESDPIMSMPLPQIKIPPPPPVWIPNPTILTDPDQSEDAESGGSRRMYECQDCGREFRTSKGRSAHRTSVHLGVRFKCDACGNIFNQKGNFLKHQRKLCPKNTNLAMVMGEEEESQQEQQQQDVQSGSEDETEEALFMELR